MLRIKVNDKAYEYDPDKLLVSEAIRLKAVSGLTVMAWHAGLKEGDPEALKALVWLAMTRAGEQVRYGDLDFDLAGLDIEDDQAEDAGGGDEEGSAAARPTASAETT